MNNFKEYAKNIFSDLKNQKRIIHCLTNPISINDMANVILSLNASPFMADNPMESKEITSGSSSLLINIGNISVDRSKSMKESIEMANEISIPVILDAVGVGASKYRNDFVNELLSRGRVSLIKGNYSEIESINKNKINSKSVDSRAKDLSEAIINSENVARRYSCMVLSTGEIDVITDGENSYILSNGVERLAKVTGTGCIVGAICAVFLSVRVDLRSVILASSIMNIAGELVEEEAMASFRIKLLDEISLMNEEKIMERIKCQKI